MIQEEPTDSYTKHMFHVFLLCDKPSRSSSGSNPIAATIRKVLRIQDFLLFYPEAVWWNTTLIHFKWCFSAKLHKTV